MRGAALAFVAGAWCLQQQAQLLEARTVVGVGVGVGIGAVLVAVAARRVARRIDPRHVARDQPRSRRRRATILVGMQCARVGVLIAACAIGFCWASWRASDRLADTLPHDLEGRDLVVVGTVATLPYIEDRGTRFAFTVESVLSRDADGRPLAVPTHLALGWYRPMRDFAPQKAARATGASIVPVLRPGQRWRLTVRLKRPHGSANPFGFDYEYWLLEEGLRASGYVRPGIDPGDTDDADDADAALVPPTATRKLADFVWSANHLVERTRAHLRDRVLTVLADGGAIRVNAPYAGVIVALIVGDQRAIAQSDWTVFNRTGIGHLVSISGLHVSMLAALGSWLTFAAWRRRPGWCARLPAHKAAALAGTLVALLYCLLAGFGVPAQRTLYMIGVVAFALWTQRLTSVSRVLCLALAIVVAVDPWAVTGSGFWLSFTAVAAIFYATSGRLEFDRSAEPWWRRPMHAMRTAGRVQWAVTLALTPLTLLFFYQVSIISPAANALAIPLVSFVVTPLALAGAVIPGFAGALLLHAAHGLVELLAAWLAWLSGSSIAVWTGAAPSAAAFVAAMVGVAWWLAPRGIAWRWTGALWMLPLFAAPLDRPAVGTVRLTALDIGQGNAVLVETTHLNLLYDTGPQYAPTGDNGSNDAGIRIIVPFLRARGIDHLDRMIISHNDLDHSGGALSILQSLPVVETRSSLVLDVPIVRASARHVRCLVGQSWTIDDVRFDLLGPSPDVYLPREGKAAAKPNAKSCVLRIWAGGRVAILPADIEKPQEAGLVERDRDAEHALLPADVLLVPHHGSRTSSTDAFLDAVHPRLAIVQSGYLNRYGHPRPDVLARYAARDIPIVRNDRDGAITVVLGAAGIDVARYRDTHRRYWYED